MASVKALLYKSKKKADGRHPIVIRIIKDRKPKYVYVEWIFEKHWDLKNLKVKSSHPNSKRLNNLLKKKLVEADDLILESEAQNRNYTSEQIAKLVKGEKRISSFFKLSESYILDLQKRGKHNRASSDGGKINRIKEFMNNKDLQFLKLKKHYLKN